MAGEIYEDILDTEMASGKPVKPSIPRRNRDNLLAVLQGNSTHKVETDAIADDAVTPAKMASPTSGTTNLLMRLLDEEITPSSGSYPSVSQYLANDPQAHLSCRCINAGTVTVYAQHRAITTSGTPTQSLRVLKNGTLVQEWNTLSLSYQTRTVGVSVSVGDIISVQYKYAGSAGRVQNVRIYSDTEAVAVA